MEECMHWQTYALMPRKTDLQFTPTRLSLPSVVWRVIIFLVLGVAFPAIARSAGAVCVKGLPEQVDPMAPSLRPVQTAQCAYGFDEFVARLTALITDKQSMDSVETVKMVFGLPDMTTAYDDPRIAAYSLDISGKDGWKVRVGVYEGFYPLNKGPARFVPGIHPKRLYKVTDATLRIGLSISAFQEASWIGVQCPSVNDMESALEKAGWKKMKLVQPLDGDIMSTDFQYGNKAVWLNAECSKLVPEAILLSQKPAKP
jgi:hypothetical protein